MNIYVCMCVICLYMYMLQRDFVGVFEYTFARKVSFRMFSVQLIFQFSCITSTFVRLSVVLYFARYYTIQLLRMFCITFCTIAVIADIASLRLVFLFLWCGACYLFYCMLDLIKSSVKLHQFCNCKQFFFKLIFHQLFTKQIFHAFLFNIRNY